MKKILLFLLFAAAVVAPAQETWLGLFMQNKQIGYSSNLVRSEKLHGRHLTRSDSTTHIRAGLLGTSMTMDMKSSTWTAHGKPMRMVFRMESSHRVQSMDAVFGPDTVRIAVVNGDSKTNRVLPLPKDGIVVDDTLSAAVTGGKPHVNRRAFYVLDPLTVSLVRNTVAPMGKVRVNVRGKTMDATRFDISDPRAVTKVYLNSKGDLIKAEGPMGIEMIPLPKRDALAAGDASPGPDLAEASSVKSDRDIPDASNVRSLELRISGRDLSRLPSDEHQTVRKDGKSWLVDVHPVDVAKAGDAPIATASEGKSSWIKPSLYIPSDRARFKTLAARIIGGTKTVLSAARKIQEFVNRNMLFNAGIGVLRDAGEVLSSKEGVCRDYAVLTTTLLRSARIPARVVGGVVYADGRFYYHAWSEAWDGAKWVGVDSTRTERQITATHVKLADGNVDQAFMFSFLGDAKIEVLKIGYVDGDAHPSARSEASDGAKWVDADPELERRIETTRVPSPHGNVDRALGHAMPVDVKIEMLKSGDRPLLGGSIAP